jgi:hypothetical protein
VATKADFDEQAWRILRETPQLVGSAMMMAGPSGLGTVKESFAIGQGLVQGQASRSPLIQALNTRDEIIAAQDEMKEWMRAPGSGDPKARFRAEALEKARAAVAALKANASPEELAAYRDWVYSLAEGVAKAAREGGVLGFGGVEVSPGEQSLLDELKVALNS